MRDLHSLFGELSLALFGQMTEHAAKAGSRSPRPFTLAVGSARRGEGRTFLAEGLALHAASLGTYRVVLVDGDLRHPDLTLRQDGRGKAGLSDFLGGSEEAPALLKTRMPNLSIIGAGRSDDVTLLYRQGGMSSFLSRLDAFADVVLIDMPPFATDAAPITTAVDRVLLVVDATVTPRQEAKAALARVPKAKSWGAVLNRCAPGSLMAVS